MAENAYIEEYLQHLADRKYTRATIENRRQSLGKYFSFLAAAGIGQIRDVTTDILEKYRLRMFESGLASGTVETHLLAARVFHGFLEERGILFENPAEKMTLHKQVCKLGDVLTEAEVRKMLSLPDTSRKVGLRDRAMLEVLYSTGIRREELLKLTIFDIDTQKQSLRVIGKGSKERVLPLGKVASKYVELYLRHSRPKFARKDVPGSDALWLGVFKIPIGIQSPAVITRKYARKAGIKKSVSTHTLRRTCATHMLRRGAHPFMIAEMLGHADLKTLSHYLNVSISDLTRTHAKSRPGK
jgi:integrase/recombinase XerD